MALRPYQTEGVEFLEKRSHAILADEPGLGKSAQAIVAAEKRNFKNILIVCPAIGRVSWPIELAKWDMAQRDIIHVGKSYTPPTGNTGRIFIVSYDTLSRGGPAAVNLASLAKNGAFDLLVLDEGQYLKDVFAKRTKFVYGQLVPHIKTVWVLSGTITPNHNGELYPHVKGLFPELIPHLANRFAFEDRYCKVKATQFGRQIAGNQNTKELRDALEPHLLRRRADSVRSELPDLTIDDLDFDEDAIEAMLAPSQIKALDEACVHFDKAFRESHDLDDIGSAILRSYDTHLATARRALGLAKVPLASAWATDLLESGQDKVILFVHHKDVAAALTAALLDYNPVTITGETDTKSRVERVGIFQNAPLCRVLVGNIQAAGTSITLTASNRVGLVEPSWVPGDNSQAIRRSYRIGQKRAVTATYLSVAGSLDAEISATLIRKSNDIAELLDTDKETA